MATAILSQQTIEEAHQLALQGSTWNTGRSKRTGETFFIIPSRSEPGVAHWTSQKGCTCRGARKRGNCAHREAVTMFLAREKAFRRPRASLDDLLDAHLVSAF